MRIAGKLGKRFPETRLEPQHMVRAALVNGLKGDEVDTYIELIDRYTSVKNPRRLLKLMDIIRENSLTPSQANFLSDLLVQFGYGSDLWKPFDYSELKNKGIILTYKGSTAGLAREIGTLPRDKVLAITSDICRPGVDYHKHISKENKLMLDSKRVIELFADLKKMTLEKGWRKNKGIYADLGLYEFSFRAALFSAIIDDFEIGDINHSRDTSVITYRIPGDKNEVRLRFIEMIKAAEYHHFLAKTGQLHRIKHLKTPKEDYYRGGAAIWVPKRTPDDNNGIVNKVEFHYVPQFKPVKEDEYISWVHFDPYCSCDYGFNERNFMDRTSKKTLTRRTANVFDMHAGVAMLDMIRQLGLDPNQCSNNMNPVFNSEVIGWTDNMRYNSYVEEKGGRRMQNDIEMEIVLHYLMKQNVKKGLLTPAYSDDHLIQKMY